MIAADPFHGTGLGFETARTGHPRRLRQLRFRPVAPLVAALPRLRAIDPARLPVNERSWLETAVWFAERAQELGSLPYGGMDEGYPVPYLISHLTGLYLSVPHLLGNSHPIASRGDAEDYLGRLETFHQLLDAECTAARADAALGVVPPQSIVKRAVTQLEALLALDHLEMNLIRPLVRGATESGLSGAWEERAHRLVDGAVADALRRQLALLQSWIPSAPATPGIWRLPDGERFYAHALRFHTTTTKGADEVHRTGLEQVAELSAEADTLLKAQGLNAGTVAERLGALGRVQSLQFANGDSGRQQLIAYAGATIAALRARMPEIFRTLPDAPMEVRRVPKDLEAGSPGAYAEPGSPDGERPGIFYVAMANMEGRPRWRLPTLVCHEAVPGHLWHRALLGRNTQIPELHRTLSVAAYDEGWGMYSETLGDELGLYRDDRPGRIGMIQSLLFRATRLVVDTGIHSKGWSSGKASAYFREVLGNGLEREIDRYAVWPAQATAYKLGHDEMLRIRDDARQRMSRGFDIKAYHEHLLAGGPMPLEILADRMRQWAEAPVR